MISPHIQFNCPACGTLLRLPLAMSTAQGPCPSCRRGIIAPDPLLGIGAVEAPFPPPPQIIESFRRVPAPAPVPKVENSPPPVMAEPPASRAYSRALPIAFCFLLTVVVALALGFALGMRSTPRTTSLPMPPSHAALPQEEAPSEILPPPPKPSPAPTQTATKPTPAQASKSETKPEITEVTALAESALRAFLDAPDWASRSAHVLFPEKVRNAMEAHSHQFPDGPTLFNSLTLKRTQVDEISGETLSIFFVSTDQFPSGIPVAVQETPSGCLVDWRAFVEFRDQLFQKFADGPGDSNGRFYLIASPPPAETATKPINEHFVSLLLNAPLNPTPHPAFIKKASETFATFQQTTASGGFFTPVLEVQKRKTADGQTYLEVVKVIATDWVPKPSYANAH